jgi:hypothetical protein
VPNLLNFREYPYFCHGIYDEDSLIGTFILHPYSEKRGSGISRILRMERPLLNMDLSVKKRSEAFKEVRDYISDFMRDSCDIVEMELYERVDDEIYFPSSLAVVGTFNFPQDSRMIVDWSYEPVRTTICFEMLKDVTQQSDREESEKKSLRLFPFLRRSAAKANVQYSSFEPLLNREIVLQPFAFNLPEYCLVRKNPMSLVFWFPDLSKNSWRELIGYGEDMRRKIMKIDRGKIYLVLGLNTNMLLEDLNEIWNRNIFGNITKLQIFSTEAYRRNITKKGGRIVHSMKLYRKDVS